MPPETETNHDGNAHDQKDQRNSNAEVTRGALRPYCGRQSPLTKKIPDADPQMDGTGTHAQEEKAKEIRILHGLINDVVCGSAVGQEAFAVNVPAEEEKRDQAGPALESKHPIADPGILRNVNLAAIPDIESVEGVIKNREPDDANFEWEAPRDCLQGVGRLVVLAGAYQRIAIFPDVVGHVGPDGNQSR